MKYLIIMTVLSFNIFASFDHSHKSWDNLLKKYVVVKPDYNRFQYKKLQNDKKNMQVLNKYLKNLSNVSAKQYEGFSKDQKLAYLINAYNAFTIEAIFTRYPYINSIREIGAVSMGPWKRENIKMFGRMVSLHQIEKDYLIDKFNAPRIHFAINCASIGCPSMQPYAFVARKLEQQFQDSAKDFVFNKSKNEYIESKNELQISKIFEWYAYDFDEEYESVKKFLAPMLAKGNKSLEKKILNAKIKYREYNWDLNE